MLRDLDGGAGIRAEPLPTLDHPTFLRFAQTEIAELPRERAIRIALESDAPDAYVSRYPGARLVVAVEPPDAVAFVRATDVRGGRARVVVHAEGALGVYRVLTARFTVASGDVLVASREFRIVEPPPALPTDPGAKAGVLIPKVFPVSRDRWADFGFDEASVAAVSESVDDFTIAVNVDNLHLTRLVESVSYQQTGSRGFARRSSCRRRTTRFCCIGSTISRRARSIAMCSSSTSSANSIASRKRSSLRSLRSNGSMRRRCLTWTRRTRALGNCGKALRHAAITARRAFDARRRLPVRCV